MRSLDRCGENEARAVTRYLLLSAAIVLTVFVVVGGWMNRELIRIKIASVFVKVSPKPAGPLPTGSAAPVALHGDAPWALSALPECLIQMSDSTGPIDFLRPRIPSGAVRVASGTTLQYADCTIFVSGDEAYVRRGGDRFRIPPKVVLYRSPNALALLRVDPNGMTELRVYQPATP